MNRDRAKAILRGLLSGFLSDCSRFLSGFCPCLRATADLHRNWSTDVRDETVEGQTFLTYDTWLNLESDASVPVESRLQL